MNTFVGLLAALVRSEVKFLLVGGLAVELAGFTRATMDMDILVEDSPSNLQRLLSVLANFGEGSARELEPHDFTPEEGCIRVVEDFPLDIFTRMGGRDYQDLLTFSCHHEFENIQLPYVGAEGLLLLKEGSNRPKDQLDVLELQKLIHKNKEDDPHKKRPPSP